MNTEIKYGEKDLIPISQIVARTKVRLQLKSITDYDDEIEMFINEAAAGLGTKPTFVKKNVQLKITDGRAKLPNGFKKLLGVRMVQPPLQVPLQNNIWNTQNPVFGDLVYMERTWINSCVAENIGSVGFLDSVVEISGGYLIFTIPCPFEFCFLAYEGYATNDCDGGILELAASYERCLSEYSYTMMLQTYPQLWNQEWGNRESAVGRSYNIYAEQRSKIIGDAFATDYENNKYMFKRILHALLQNQNNPNLH